MEDGASVPVSEPLGLPGLIVDQIRRENEQAAEAALSSVSSWVHDRVPFVPDDDEGSFADRFGDKAPVRRLSFVGQSALKSHWTVGQAEKDIAS